MGLFKTIASQANSVRIETPDNSIPMFRSRRNLATEAVPEWAFEEKAECHSEPSGALFDAFVDRMAAMRSDRKAS